ncbi:sensor histidine kinase [Mycolicibacterium sediminis]|uniref:histidine kinase n=1 Tax=Mycolicibacterium sediminis TaxID=1286180 RepID=A0A7I7QXT1_9MYCO|nr:HAMP domain-containing sensor histidine kinase [Mycolicibacterium sediminis]BBY31138.1 two-component sensor histidine kinase [Mycolicibacterium sediminis]
MSVRQARGWRTWPLRKQLVVGVSAVVTTVLMTVGTMSVLTLRASVTGIVDTQLNSAAEGFSQSVTKYRASPLPTGAMPSSDAMKPLTYLIGQAPGNIVVLMRDGQVVDTAMFGDGDATAAPPSAVRELTERAGTLDESVNLWLPDLGKYRLTSRPAGPGEVLLTAASLRQASAAATRETIVVAILTALALIVTAAGTLAIVRVALRPLGRVASTAAEVAETPLNRDRYAITPRVPEGDTDARTEVGLVGDTLNRLLDNVERALTEVSASDRRMRQFITDASHELRTPLAAIQGYAELTRQDSSVLPETTEYSLARIEAEAARMNALVSDLLLLARLDEGQDFETTDVDVADLVVNAVNDVAVSAPDHGWTIEVPDHPVWARGDRAKLHQAVTNLLSNARDHTPEGTAVVAHLEAGTAITLTVRDDGPGIERELLPHLFERFVRADKARMRQSGNSGLGLAIAQSIVEAHGGTIVAESADGRTTFTIELPAATTSVSPELDLAVAVR